MNRTMYSICDFLCAYAQRTMLLLFLNFTFNFTLASIRITRDGCLLASLSPPMAGAPLELLLENGLSSTALFCSVECCKPPASATTWSSNNRTCDLERSNTLRKGESSSQLYLSLQSPTEAHRISCNKFLHTHTHKHTTSKVHTFPSFPTSILLFPPPSLDSWHVHSDIFFFGQFQ